MGFIKFIIFGLFVLGTKSCDLSKEEKQQLNSARRAIERAYADVGRLVHESRDFARTAHNARKEARKNMDKNPDDENTKLWFERLAEGVRKIHRLADKINDEAHKIGTAKNDMEKCLDRKDLIMCRELANTAKNALNEAKKYRIQIGDSYRNAYTQTDLGIAELAEKVRDSGRRPTETSGRRPTVPKKPAVIPTLPSVEMPVYDEFDVERG